MDPDANLEEQLELSATLFGEDGGTTSDEDDVLRLCELVHSLDEWLSKGGFFPKKWERKEVYVVITMKEGAYEGVQVASSKEKATELAAITVMEVAEMYLHAEETEEASEAWSALCPLDPVKDAAKIMEVWDAYWEKYEGCECDIAVSVGIVKKTLDAPVPVRTSQEG